jgi:hypothetical protein
LGSRKRFGCGSGKTLIAPDDENLGTWAYGFGH